MNDATLPKPTPKPLLTANDDTLLSPPTTSASVAQGGQTAGSQHDGVLGLQSARPFPGVIATSTATTPPTMNVAPPQVLSTAPTSPQTPPVASQAVPTPLITNSAASSGLPVGVKPNPTSGISLPGSPIQAISPIQQQTPTLGLGVGNTSVPSIQSVPPTITVGTTKTTQSTMVSPMHVTAPMAAVPNALSQPSLAPATPSLPKSTNQNVTTTPVSTQTSPLTSASLPIGLTGQSTSTPSVPQTVALSQPNGQTQSAAPAPLSADPQRPVTPVSVAPVPPIAPPSSTLPVTPMGGRLVTLQPVAPIAPVPPSTPTPPVVSASSGADNPPGSRLIKKSLLRVVPIVVGVLLVLGLAIFAISRLLNRGGGEAVDQQPTPVQEMTEITYWGLWEPTTVMTDVFKDFESQNAGVRVQYVQQSHKEYRERLQTAIATGQGPDVFRFHASWVPMLRSELSPVPERVMSTEDFSKVFYPVATQQLTVNQKPIGMPTMIDGLGLYYNTDIFSIANKTVPQNWEEVKTTAQDLTIRSGETLTRGGIALGTTANVEHFSDIIGLMMLQNGADPAAPTSPEAEEALAFYMSFADTLKVWDDSLPAATLAFSRGDVAMMIAPSWRVHEVKALNANLNFEIAPVPQLPGADRITWASYWAEGVSAQSKQKELAWKLVNYLASAEVQQKVYAAAREQRAFGPIYSRVDIAEELASQPYVGAYIADAPYARSWYLNAYTHDNGINDRISKYFHDAVNAANTSSLETTLQTAALGVTQVLQQYGLAVAAPPASVAQ